MKKWVIVIVIAGMLGWAAYDFIDSKKETEALQSVETLNENDPTDFVGLNVGETAPDFSLETMEGETIQLSELRGEKVMLNFWASWCPPCQAEMPDIQKYHENGEGAIVSVNLIETETSEKHVANFINDYDLTFPVLVDHKSQVANLYTAQALPTSYLIDTEGKIGHIAIGPLNYEQLVDGFEKMN